MQIAYLKRHSIDLADGVFETFTLKEDISNANEVSMLKARTLLSYLYDSGLLKTMTGKSDTAGDWLFYYTEEAKPQIETFAKNVYGLDEDVCAILPVEFMSSSEDQPGIIAIRNDPTIRATFVNSFLYSSKKWLQRKGPGQAGVLAALQSRYRQVA